MKHLASFLLGSVVFAASSLGVAGSPSVDMVVTVTNFDAKTGLLVGTLAGGAAADFQRTGTTTYQPTDPHQLPPGPCRQIAKVWNFALKQQAPPFIMDLLLFDMSLSKCQVRVATPPGAPASTGGGGAMPILAIKPGN